MSEEGAAADLLSDRPDLERPLERIAEVDAERETWTFEDVPVESGPFGELVSRGVVESVDEAYRLADPAATRALLDGDPAVDAGASGFPAVSISDLSLPAVDRTTAAVVAAALAFVALVRVHPVRSIYRNGDVVLSGNDPYYYRYWVEQAVASSSTVVDLHALATLPNAVRNGEPLMVATLWWVSELLGGGPDAVSHVMAWYPVASAVLTAGLVYLLAVRVTDDRRIGLAAVLVLALIPGHAMRTSLGYADHHAFDYPWLVVTALALVSLVGTRRDWRSDRWTWAAAGALGVGIAGQTLAWEAGPLLIAPLGLVVVARALLDVADDRSPVDWAVPVVAGVAVGAGLTAAVHQFVGWHSAVVAFAPALLLVGSVGALATAVAVHRTSGDVRHLGGVYAAGVLAGLAVLRFGLPSFWGTLAGRLGTLFAQRDIAETLGLFSPESFGFIFLFGFTLVLALPAMAWALPRAREDGRWLVATAYAWYFFLLATVQVRFVGELAAFAAVFAGVGFVGVAAWVDATAPLSDAADRLRVPDRNTLAALAVLFLLFSSLGAMQVTVKTSQVLIEDGAYHSSSFMADHEADLEREYPANYVFSSWGRNRHYNYFVNGESASYAYAQSNFESFLVSERPDAWYDRWDGEVGYVVVPTSYGSVDQPIAYTRLVEHYGSQYGDVPGLAHFRALYVAPDESKYVFGVVPGANVTGSVGNYSSVRLSTDVSIPGEQFTYARGTETTDDGEYAVRVAYPGTYRVVAGGESHTVNVSESDVRNGTTVHV